MRSLGENKMNRIFSNLKRISLILLFCFVGVAYAVDAEKKAEETKPKVTQAVSKGDVKKPLQQPVAEVMVIASRLPTAQKKLNDASSNTTHKDAAELNETHSSTFQDAVRDIEGGVFYDAIGNGVDSAFALRGFSDPGSVIYLVDGVRVNDVDNNGVKFPLIPMRDVQSVQIERGSASSVYGSDAFGGVVNITTGQPSQKPIKLFGGLEWTSFHGLRFNQGVSGTLKDRVTPLGGKFSYYFNGERDDADGFRNHSATRLTSFDIKTAYELPDEQGKVYFGVKHIDDAINMPGEITFQQFQAGDLRVCNKPLDGWKFKNTIVQVGADKKFWEDRITASIMASERFNHRKAFTTYGAFPDWTSGYGFNPYTNFINTNATDKNLTWQLKYNETWNRIGNESLIGMEFRRGRQLSLQRYAFGGNVQEWIDPSSDHSASANNVGLFWRETLKLWDKVIPYFGMRHDFNWLKTNDEVKPERAISQRWDKSTLSTGVTVKPVKWADVFGNYSQGFRVPTMDETVPYAGASQSSLMPEKSDSYEVGTRLRYRELGAYKFSYFLIDVKDEISWDNAKNQYYNIAQTRRYGLEQRIDLAPVQEVKLYGTYTWTFAYVHNDGTSSLVKHRSLGQIPENRFTLGGVITPLKRLGEPYDGLKLGLNGVFTGKQHPSDYETSNEATLNATGGAGHWIKSYSVWNFILSYVWKKQEIYFKVNNIFDEKYYSWAYNGDSWGTAIYPAGTYTWVSPGAGREFVLGSKWEF
jgi:outer membrane receptor protein involved in Fe transport